MNRRYPPSLVGRVLKLDPSRLKKRSIKRSARTLTVHDTQPVSGDSLRRGGSKGASPAARLASQALYCHLASGICQPRVSLRQNGVGTGFTRADAILPKGHTAPDYPNDP